MPWKKEFKKGKNIYKGNDVFVVDGHSTLIFWQNSSSNKSGIYKESFFLKEVRELFERINLLLSNAKTPIKIKEYNIRFEEFGYLENFKGISFSFFKETFEYVKSKFDSYKAAIIVFALTKYIYYTNVKFYEIYNKMFSDNNVNDYNIVNLFETMRVTSMDQIQNIIQIYLLKVANIELTSDSDNNIIESLIDLGSEFTIHWSRMFREILILSKESLNFDKELSFTKEKNKNNYDWNDGDNSNFDEFFEKTKTMVINNEFDDALAYFNLNRSSSYGEFKREYRKIAKKHHPDLNNKSPEFDIEMKKINVYKNIIEKYLN